jgi:hypothetical protein
MSKTTHDIQMQACTVEWQDPTIEKVRHIDNLKQLIAEKQRELAMLTTRLHELELTR